MSAFSKPTQPRVLIVDGEAALQELLSRSLRRKGFEVAIALTAKETVKLVNNSQVHLVIVDANLEGGGGLDLLRLLKSSYPQLPVIIFTQSSYPELRGKAFEYGANGFLDNADSLQTLLLEVCRHVSQKGN